MCDVNEERSYLDIEQEFTPAIFTVKGIANLLTEAT